MNIKPKQCTISGKLPDGVTVGAPQPIDPATGQHKDYYILCDEERAKGFIRPVRRSYIHVGSRPKYPLRELTVEEKAQYAAFGYAKYEQYPPEAGPCIGRYWTEQQLHSGCGTRTHMGLKLAETYARDPRFYGGTFCCHCGGHFPVGPDGEFEWEDGEMVGT
jgi:hypothetical protein